MTVKTDKELHEKQVVSEFLASWDAAGPHSVDARRPPEPDVFCNEGALSGQYFEVARLLEGKMVRDEIRLVGNPRSLNPYVQPLFGWPERDILRTKLRKKYDTKGAMLNLLLYWDWDPENSLTLNVPPPANVPFAVVAESDLAFELSEVAHPFNRVFYFDRRTKEVLWEWRRAV